MAGPTETPHIHDEGEYHRTLATLSRADQPGSVLRLLMNAFERYRQARKIGWSRPWNKDHMRTFQSLRLRPAGSDGPLVALGRQVLAAAHPPAPALAFVDELLADEAGLLGFIFVHEYTDGSASYEGATLSLGRKREGRYRDRFDVILESPIHADQSQGCARLRLYVDPHDGQQAPLWQTTLDTPATALADGGVAAQALFAQLGQCSWQWAADPERLWDHWTSHYIDYFGPRRLPLDHSYFYLPGGAPLTGE